MSKNKRIKDDRHEFQIWECKIGEVHKSKLPYGGSPDSPMRAAVARAYFEITGEHPKFIVSGWNAKLTNEECSIV